MKGLLDQMNKVTTRLAAIAGAIGFTALLLLGPSAVMAQNDVGSIVGFVTDQTGAVIPGAQVTIVNEGTGEKRVVTTDAAGHYAVPNLQPAIYSMTAEAKGFQKFVSNHNTLASNSTVQINGKLTVGQASQTVTVSSTAEVLQTQSPAIQAEVTGTQIQKEELNGRNPIYMAQLLPGVVSTATMADLNFSFNSGDTFEVNGARQNDTKYTIDGAMASRTRGDAQIIAGANVDSVQEMQVLTGDYSAEYGSASGAQIRVITKSGTRNFHGALYEYVRNAAFNANTWSLNHAGQKRQQFSYNNFGFAVGGPVWAPKMPGLDKLRDKFFFFVNEDWVRFRQGNQQLMAVPTTLMRQGDFSELLNPSNPWYNGAVKIMDPMNSGTQFMGCDGNQPNVICPNRLSPNGVGIMNSYPAPTPGFLQGKDNFSGTAPHPENQRKGQINADIILGNHHLEFRRSDDSYNESAPYNQSNPDVPLLWQRPNQDISVGWVWTINPTTINEAWSSLSIDDVYINDNPAGIGYNRANFNSSFGGYNFGINFPYIIPGPKNVEQKIPTANMSNFSNIQGGPYPSHSSGIIYQESDSLTKVLHSHTLKFGVFFTYWGENDNDQINVSTVPGGASNQNGTFTFTKDQTGSDMANLALGLADAYTEIGTRAYTDWRGSVWEYFAQDNWQMTPKLNVSYGVRVTSTIPEHALWDNADYFDPPSYSLSKAPTLNASGNVILGTGDPYNGIVIPGVSAFPSSATKHGVGAALNASTACAGSCSTLFAPNLPKQYIAETNQFQPRLGFAYQIFPTTVLRAGVGSFVSTKGLLDNVFPGGNSPFQPTETVNNVSVDNPGASVTTGTEPALTITSLNRHLIPPTRWNWNLTVEHEIPKAQSVFQVAYVGARGYHNWDVVDINQAPAGTLTANPTASINAFRPYLGFSSIQQEQSGVNSNYNSLQASWNSHFRGGSLFGASYTWEKSMDGSSNYRDIVPDSYNMTNLWAPSEYDIPQVFMVNYLWAEPFYANQHNLAAQVLGGWQIAGNFQGQKGTPCGIGTKNDYAGVSVNDLGNFGCGSEGQFWVKTANPKHSGHFAGYLAGSATKCAAGNGAACYFTTQDSSGTALYSKPTLGTFNLQKGVRDNVRNPGEENWNISLIKAFPITESTGFEFRAEAYNFINHPNWSGPDFNPSDGNFGEITAKNSNTRNLQFGLRFHF